DSATAPRACGDDEERSGAKAPSVQRGAGQAMSGGVVMDREEVERSAPSIGSTPQRSDDSLA
ncbi:MAG: hypothetical protein DLM65_11785, partial [Candidatus Aeolococcus gillhamiae]